MLTGTLVEFHKLWRRPRTYLGFMGMCGLAFLLLVAVKYGRPFRHLEQRLAHDFIIAGSFVNASFLARYLLEGVSYTFMPLFTCLVLGDLVASEAADGTLRTVLCRPIGKTAFVVSKYVVGMVYVIVLTLFSGLAAYLIGWGFLGRGSLVVFDEGIWVFKEQDALLKLLATYGLVSVAMLAVGSMSFAISTFLSNSNAAIVGGMGLLYTSAVIQEIEYFDFLKPYLITTYFESWRKLFMDPVDTALLLKALCVLFTYALVSLVIGLAIFDRRDVLA